MMVPFDFLVVDSLNEDMILGIDFLEHTKAKIICAEKKVIFYDDLIQVNLIEKQKDVVASTDRSYILHPGTESLVRVYLSEPVWGQSVMLEPVKVRDKQRYLVAKAVVRPEGKYTVCKILNASDKKIELRRHLQIAKVQWIDVNSIVKYEEDDNTNVKTNQREENNRKPKRSLQDLGIEVNNKNLTDSQKRKLREFLEDNTDAFALGLEDLPGTTEGYCHIETGDTPPIRQRAYRPSPQAREEISNQTQDMLKNGIIIPSESPWASPCVLVKKKDGTMRFCVDFRKLNLHSVPQRWPIPLLTDVWECLSQSNSSIFTTLDMRSGYFQIPMDTESRPKTAFVVQDGTYEYTRMPFGIQAGPAVFSRIMSHIFRGLTFKTMIVYIDDLMIFSKDFDTHMEALKEVFARLRRAGLKLHPKKCKFAMEEINFLEHKINGKGVSVDGKKVEAMKNWPVPKSVKELQSFLGYCNYYRKFLRDYSKKTVPLNKLLQKDVKYVWTAECQKAFENLKELMITTPVLIHANLHKQFILTTDASQESIGYVLSQEGSDKKEHPVAFSARSLRKAENNYSVTEKECLALIEGVREFYPYLCNNDFIIVSDHLSLKWLHQIKYGKGRLFRWSLALQGLTYTVKYRQGHTNGNADALSRRPYEEEIGIEDEQKFSDDSFEIANITEKEEVNNPEEQEYLENWNLDDSEEDRELLLVDLDYQEQEVIQDTSNVLKASNIEDLQQMQNDCPDLSRIIAYLRKGELPLDNKMARQTVFESEDYFFKDGVLKHKYSPKNKHLCRGEPVVDQLAVPTKLRNKILYEYHDLAGHNSHERTYATIRKRYFWPKFYSDIFNYCKSCEVCQKIKNHTHPPKASLGVWPDAEVWERIHIDMLGPLPKTKDGYQYILLVVDAFSKWPETFKLKGASAIEVADVLYNEIFCRYGATKQLVSDRGANFLSRVVARWSKLFNIRRSTTP